MGERSLQARTERDHGMAMPRNEHRDVVPGLRVVRSRMVSKFEWSDSSMLAVVIDSP